MTKKVLVATEKPFNSAAVPQIRKIVEDAGYQLEVLEKYQSQDELLKAVADANALIVRSDKITKEVIDAAKELEVIVRAGAGYDSIDTQYAKEKGVIVENTPGQNSNAVGELVFGLLVFAARNRFNGKSGSELMGKKIGFHAFGHTARCAARIARGARSAPPRSTRMSQTSPTWRTSTRPVTSSPYTSPPHRRPRDLSIMTL